MEREDDEERARMTMVGIGDPGTEAGAIIAGQGVSGKKAHSMNGLLRNVFA